MRNRERETLGEHGSDEMEETQRQREKERERVGDVMNWEKREVLTRNCSFVFVDAGIKFLNGVTTFGNHWWDWD